MLYDMNKNVQRLCYLPIAFGAAKLPTEYICVAEKKKSVLRGLDLTEGLHCFFGACTGLFDDLDDFFELGSSCIADEFVDEALAGGDNGARMPQPCQGDGYFFLVAATHSICEDVDFVASIEQINGRLCYADVAFNAD